MRTTGGCDDDDELVQANQYLNHILSRSIDHSSSSTTPWIEIELDSETCHVTRDGLTMDSKSTLTAVRSDRPGLLFGWVETTSLHVAIKCYHSRSPESRSSSQEYLRSKRYLTLEFKPSETGRSSQLPLTSRSVSVLGHNLDNP